VRGKSANGDGWIEGHHERGMGGDGEEEQTGCLGCGSTWQLLKDEKEKESTSLDSW
jgi:hypothetical protein